MLGLKDLLANAGISKVVWVDDCHAQKIDEQLIIEIQARVAALVEKGTKPSHAAFATLEISDPSPVRSSKIERMLPDFSDSLLVILDSLVDDLGEQYINTADLEDLTSGQVSALLKGFPNVQPLSYANWAKESKDIFTVSDDTTLFLIDREFTNENQGAEVGDEIVASIVSAVPLAHCIMLTHKVRQEEAEELRSQVVTRTSGLERHQFAIMSKRELGMHCNDADCRLAQALKTVFLHRFCYDLAQETSEVMQRAISHAIKDLIGLSVEDIDKTIFESSLNEGASEVDVITRIINLRQRTAVQDYLVSAPLVFERLSRIRAVRACSIFKDKQTDVRNNRQSPVHKWRLSEVFDDGEHVNRIHSPLCCGDIFKNTETEERFVLLAQPCDIAVRGSVDHLGHRQTEEAIFVRVSSMNKDDVENKKERFHEIEGMEMDGKSWIFDFKKAVSVNLYVLDLAVFNSEGKVVWNFNQGIPKLLLPGWQERFKKKKTNITSSEITPKFAYLSLNPIIANNKHIFKIHGNSQTCGIPLQRIGRIRSPYADAILCSYSAYISRAAFNHNFAGHL